MSRVCIVAVALAAGCTALPPAEGTRPLDRSRKLTAAEQQELDEKLPGMTRDEAVRLLGRPDEESRSLLVYSLGTGSLKLNLQDGVVARVYHNAYQSGLRIEDFKAPDAGEP